MHGLWEDYDRQLHVNRDRNARKLDRRKVGNNTYLERRGEAIAVKLHATDVVLIERDDSATLHDGGWQTVTTKERMSTYGPLQVGSDRGVWYLYRWDAQTSQLVTVGRYFDGVIISADNVILNPEDGPTLADDERVKDTRKAIRAYAKRCASEIPEPSPGDCFICQTDSGTDCLASHVAEGYVHGSLILRALKAKGFRDPYLIMHMGLSDNVARAVRTYMSRALIPNRPPMR